MGKITDTTKEIGKGTITVGGKIAESQTGVKFLGKIVSCVGKWGLSFIPIEFVCNNCDSMFTVTFDTNEDVQDIKLKKLPMPEEIILQAQNYYIESLKKKRPYISMVIFALLTLYCVVYLFIGFSDGNVLQIAVAFFFAIPFLIPTILKCRKISSLNRQIEECNYQSPREFKNTHKYLFRNYPQYN